MNGAMAMLGGIVLLTVTACTLVGSILESESFLVGEQGSGSGQESLQGSGSGQESLQFQQPNVLPVCTDSELLTFDGTLMVCRRIPERRCRCAEVPEIGSADILFPLPPEGCPVFEPPARGAFACLLVGDAVIYCSVYCESRYEFSSTPLNPYTCGAPTRLRWIDFTNQTHPELPKCTGFRHRLRPLYPDDFYLPTACDQLTEGNITTVKNNFCELYTFFTFMDCNTNDVVIQCPRDD